MVLLEEGFNELRLVEFSRVKFGAQWQKAEIIGNE